MMYKDTFWNLLHASPWMGMVCETGLGMPFTDACTKIPGASGTLLYSESPYNKKMQPDIGRPSVSREMAEHLAQRLWSKIESAFSNDILQANRFALAVTGAYKRPDERGQTHGWVCLKTGSSSGEIRTHTMHFTIPKREGGGKEPLNSPEWTKNSTEISREEAIRRTLKIVSRFVAECLELEQHTETGNHFGPGPYWGIDVYNHHDGVDLEDHLRLVNKTNPLVYHAGEFHRAQSYLRKYTRIMRGSFNPIHDWHLEMGGKKCLYEISLSNARKGQVRFDDLAHRVKMLDLMGVPVLITTGHGTFVELNRMLRHLGLEEEIIYVVGMDTMHAIVHDHYIPHEGYLDHLKAGVHFEAWSRYGIDNTIENDRGLSIEVKSTENRKHHSSTAARDGEHDHVPEPVSQYIIENKLYNMYPGKIEITYCDECGVSDEEIDVLSFGELPVSVNGANEGESGNLCLDCIEKHGIVLA
jgi:nicotinic acid mononucleotide adenylyltransferase